MMRAIVAKEQFGRYGVFTPYTDWSNRLIFALDWWRASLQPALGLERHAVDCDLETLKASWVEEAALAILEWPPGGGDGSINGEEIVVVESARTKLECL